MSVKFFGQYLIEHNAIQRADLFRALGLQEKNNLRFGDIVLEMGLMTEEQVVCVHQAQRCEDLRFGEMAVKMDYLTPEQVNQVLEMQGKKYLFIGEALVKLGVLNHDQLNTYLEQYNLVQKPLYGNAVEIPSGIPHRSIWNVVAEMNCKMLTRFVGLSYRLGPCRRVDSCPQRQVTVTAGLTGEINARLLITLSKKTGNQIAGKVLNVGPERTYPDTILEDALVRYFNLVCGNIVRKAMLLRHEIDLIPASLQRCHEGIKKVEAETGLLIPIHLPEGDVIEITIFTMEKVTCLA